MRAAIANLSRPLLRSLQIVSVVVGGALLLAFALEGVYRVQRTAREKLSDTLEWQVPAEHPYAGAEWYEKFRYYPSPVYVHDPYRTWRVQPMQMEYMTINADGYRATVQSVNAAPTREIWLLGGTVMWGSDARDAQTIPSRVAQRLAELGDTDVKVVNLALPYFNFMQESITLLKRLSSGERPVAAVFLNGLTDLRLAREHGQPGHADFENRNRALFQAGWYGRSIGDDALDIVRRSQLLQRLGLVGAPLPTGAPEDTPFSCPQAVGYYQEMARSISGVGAAHGFEVIFARQPDPSDRVEPRPEWERQWPVEGEQKLCGEVIDATMSASTSARYLSLHGIFDADGEPRFLRRDGTLTEAANAIVAERIADTLHDVLQKKASLRLVSDAE
jgi:hypothetical protein